jgi:hypothetical protein
MWHRHPHDDPVKALVAFLNNGNAPGLTERDVTDALNTLGLALGAIDETGPSDGTQAGGSTGDLVCMDGSPSCAGEVTTIVGSRHVRCEKHWSVFLESEGM